MDSELRWLTQAVLLYSGSLLQTSQQPAQFVVLCILVPGLLVLPPAVVKCGPTTGRVSPAPGDRLVLTPGDGE